MLGEQHREEQLAVYALGAALLHAQAALFRSIIAALPPDPQLQPWVAAALTPAHLEALVTPAAPG